MDTKMCTVCREAKPATLEYFYGTSQLAGCGLKGVCIVCMPPIAREKQLRTKYRLSLEEYDRLLAEQGGGCGMCGSDNAGRWRNFHVDHDHKCCPTSGKSCGKCVRGLLCGPCNRILGQIENHGAKAASYLARYEERR